MNSTLAITTPAESLQLLSIEEMRVAAGLAADDDDQDEVLEARGLGVAASIMSECNIAVGAGGEPTLLKETLTETFECVDARILVLSRRHNVVVSSVTVDGSAVDAATYTVDGEAGILRRKGGLPFNRWRASELVVVYDAGFEDVPGDLKQEALDRFTSITSEAGRDPYVKGETVDIPGIESRRIDYWAGYLPGANDAGSSSAPSAALKRYRNSVVA